MSHQSMDHAMKQSVHQCYKKYFHISKCLACNAKKTIRAEDNKKRMSIASYINIYTSVISYENDSN